MLYEALAASGLFFWIAVFLAFLFVSWPLGKDNAPGALFAAAIVIIGFVMLTDVIYRVSGWALVFALPIYVLIGVGWALFKWRGFVLEAKASVRARWEAGPKDKTLDQAMALDGARPTAAREKERITAWMALWPWSMSWVVLRFPWRSIVWIYDRISTVFERWSAKLWQE